MTNTVLHSWIAAGADEYALTALCEHLPANPAIVTTREALTAQLEAQAKSYKNAVILLDDTALAPELTEALVQFSGALHVLALKSSQGKNLVLKHASVEYIEKPVKISAIRRALSRMMRDASEVGDISISPDCTLKFSFRVIINPQSGAEAELTEKESQILHCLSKRRPKPTTREELHKEVWGFQGELNTHTLETHIYRLRTKLKDIGAMDARIESTPQGYVLA